jgi:recombination protein RecA
MAKTKEKKTEADVVNDERKKALDLALSRIERDYGKGSIMRFSEKSVVDVPVIPSGALSLDIALGVGGYPRGRIVEIYGPESSGKTTLALHAVASAQRQGGIAAYIDAEHAMDPNYSRALGVNLDELLISQPDSGEQALNIAETLINSNAVDIIVVDSVAALVPRSEIEGDIGDSQPGAQARLMSQAMRKLTAGISRSNTCMIFINQIREKIGVMFGNPETTTGGNALKFYSSMRIDIRRIAAIKEGDIVTGSRTRVKIVKNKVAAPFREMPSP